MSSHQHFASDPFGLFPVSNSGLGAVSPKSKSSIWGILFIFILVCILAILYFFRDAVYRLFQVKVAQLHQKINVEPSTNTDQTPTVLETVPVKKVPIENKKRLLPAANIVAEFLIDDKANWDLPFIEQKKQEGKAYYVKNKGWLIYA